MFTPGDLMLRRWSLIGGACALAIYGGIKIPETPLLAMLLMGLAAYVLTLGVNYRWLAWWIIATEPAALILPMLPGRPFFWEAFALAAWPSLVAHFALRQRTPAGEGAPLFDRETRAALGCLVVYGTVLAVLMLVRGIGFRVFGGEQMGGRFYVQQLILMVLPVLFAVVDWSERTVLRAFFTGLALATTYLVSDLVFAYGGPTTRLALLFLEVPTDAVNFYVGFEATGLRRLQSLAIVGQAGLYALLVLVPLREITGRRSWLVTPVLLALLGLGLASGHRTILVLSAFTLLNLGAIQRIYTPGRVILLTLLIVAGMWSLYTWSERLPMGMQRAVSFLPGIKVDPLAEADATATLRDRVEALKLGVGDIPRYLWLGRGFGLERLDQRTAGAQDDGILIAYENGYFDNGLIGLLLKVGLPGLLAALGYVWFVSRAAWDCLGRIARRVDEQQDMFDRYCQLVVALWFATAVFYFLIRGDASGLLQALGLQSALVLLCRRMQVRRETEAGADAPPAP